MKDSDCLSLGGWGINVYRIEFQCLSEQWGRFTCLELLCSGFSEPRLVGDNGSGHLSRTVCLQPSLPGMTS